jgi:hypothetical protein
MRSIIGATFSGLFVRKLPAAARKISGGGGRSPVCAEDYRHLRRTRCLILSRMLLQISDRLDQALLVDQFQRLFGFVRLFICRRFKSEVQQCSIDGMAE